MPVQAYLKWIKQKQRAAKRKKASKISADAMDSDSCWVTVFGFPKELADKVVKMCRKFGDIIDYKMPPGGCNWLYIRYACRRQAKMAATAKNAQLLTPNIMIGVKHRGMQGGGHLSGGHVVYKPTTSQLSPTSHQLFNMQQEEECSSSYFENLEQEMEEEMCAENDDVVSGDDMDAVPSQHHHGNTCPPVTTDLPYLENADATSTSQGSDRYIKQEILESDIEENQPMSLNFCPAPNFTAEENRFVSHNSHQESKPGKELETKPHNAEEQDCQQVCSQVPKTEPVWEQEETKPHDAKEQDCQQLCSQVPKTEPVWEQEETKPHNAEEQDCQQVCSQVPKAEPVWEQEETKPHGAEEQDCQQLYSQVPKTEPVWEQEETELNEDLPTIKNVKSLSEVAAKVENRDEISHADTRLLTKSETQIGQDQSGLPLETEDEKQDSASSPTYVTRQNFSIDQQRHLERVGIFSCAYCCKVFKSKKGLKSHQQTHFAVYKCGKCETVSKDWQMWMQHVEKHIASDRDRCNSNTNVKSNFAAYKCGKCHKTLKDRLMWMQHVEEHTVSDRGKSNLKSNFAGYKCGKCHKTLKDRLMWIQHTEEHIAMDKLQWLQAKREKKSTDNYCIDFETNTKNGL